MGAKLSMWLNKLFVSWLFISERHSPSDSRYVILDNPNKLLGGGEEGVASSKGIRTGHRQYLARARNLSFYVSTL